MSHADFFLGSRSSIVQLELIEITHPAFTQAYRIVRNHADGVTVDLSPSELAVDFDYYPVRVTQTGARDDLDASIKIDFGDLGEILPLELDAVAEAGGFLTKPTIFLNLWAIPNFSPKNFAKSLKVLPI